MGTEPRSSHKINWTPSLYHSPISLPLIGRPANSDKRELVIGRSSHGYVALYRYIVEIDTVFVLAVRNQQEACYAGL